jgi:hypothetical protein
MGHRAKVNRKAPPNTSQIADHQENPSRTPYRALALALPVALALPPPLALPLPLALALPLALPLALALALPVALPLPLPRLTQGGWRGRSARRVMTPGECREQLQDLVQRMEALGRYL